MKQISKCLYPVIGLGLSVISSSALAITPACIDVISFVIPQCAGDQVCIDQIMANHPECFGTTSSTAASTQSIETTAIQQILTISDAISTRPTLTRRPQPEREKTAGASQIMGLAAGDAAAQWNMWGSVSADHSKYERGGYLDNFATLRNNRFDIRVNSLIVGADYQWSPSVTPGLSIALDNGSGWGQSFAGAWNPVVSQSSSGYSIAPYVGWQINQDWTMDATLGFGSMKTNSDGLIGKTDRLFYGANFNYVSWKDNWQLSGKGSLLHGEEKSGNVSNAGVVVAGTATKNSITQVRVEGMAGYWMDDSMMPYFSLGFANDISRSAAKLGSEIGANALLWTLGVNFFSMQNSLTGGISYSMESGRSYSSNSMLMANINYRF